MSAAPGWAAANALALAIPYIHDGRTRRAVVREFLQACLRAMQPASAKGWPK